MAIPVQVENEVITGKSLRSETCGMEYNASVIKAMTATLYNYKKEAVVREYSTNITDSHTDTGCPEKAGYVKVPTQIDPTIEFHDKGVGLSVDDVYNIFTVLGRSTKRGDNKTSGSMGFGSKSYAAVSDQMTVTSVKNGVKIVVLCYMNRQGELAADVKSEKMCDEENGTIISIPVKLSEVSSWQEACARVLGAFRVPHKVNTFGAYQDEYDAIREVCETARKEGSVFVQDTSVELKGHRSNTLALMGDILYDLPDFNNLIGNTRLKTVAQNMFEKGFYVTCFNIGDLDHAPSREAISYDPQTFTHVRKRINSDINKYYKDFCKQVGDVTNINFYKFYHKFYKTPVWETLEHHELPFTKGKQLRYLDPACKGGYYSNYYGITMLAGYDSIRGFIPSAGGSDVVFSSSVQVLDQSRILKIRKPVIVYSENEKGIYKIKESLQNIHKKFETSVLYVDSKEIAEHLQQWLGEGDVICGDSYSPKKTLHKSGGRKGGFGIKQDSETVATFVELTDSGYTKTSGKVDLSQEGVYYVPVDEIIIKGILPKKETKFYAHTDDVLKMLKIVGGKVAVFKNNNNKGKISRNNVPSLSEAFTKIVKSYKKDIIQHLVWEDNPMYHFTDKEKVIIENKPVTKKLIDTYKVKSQTQDVVKNILKVSKFNLTETKLYEQQKLSRDKLQKKVKDIAQETLTKLPLADMFGHNRMEDFKYYLKLEKVIK